jgi:hypothetical protein
MDCVKAFQAGCHVFALARSMTLAISDMAMVGECFTTVIWFILYLFFGELDATQGKGNYRSC